MWIIQNYSQTKSRLCKCIHYSPEHLQENRGISPINNYPLCQRVAERGRTHSQLAVTWGSSRDLKVLEKEGKFGLGVVSVCPCPPPSLAFVPAGAEPGFVRRRAAAWPGRAG